MKNAAILATSFAMAHLAGAAPLNGKRDITYTTATEEVWETFWTTTTVWVEPSAAPASLYEIHSALANSFYTSSTTPVDPTPPSSSVAASSVQFKSPVVAAPSTSISVSVAPTPATTYVAPTPTSTYVAPSPTSPTSTYVAPTSVYVAPVSSTTAVAATSGGATHTGDLTYYDVEVGLGSCGTSGLNTEALVALSTPDMANGANPNSNPKCGTFINVVYQGQTHQAKVHDTCQACKSGDIDVTDSFFTAVAPAGDGRVSGVSWSFA